MGKILVTGANGFIGKAVVSSLEKHGETVLPLSSKDGDIIKEDTMTQLENDDIGYVIHLAAKTFVPDSWVYTKTFYETNFMGTLNVLEFCRRKQISMTYVSAYVYGEPLKNPISEDHSINSNNPYGHSKYLAEQLCEFYAKQFKLNITVIRPFNVYGAGQSDRFLIPHIIKQALYSDEITVMDLYPKRDYVFIDDLAQAIIASMKVKENFSVYNIGSGQSFSVGEIINKVQKILGSNKRVISTNNIRKNEINDVVADISTAINKLGWQPEFTIEQGIASIINDEKRM